MVENNIGGVAVVNGYGALTGVFSLSDLKLIAKDKKYV